MVEPSVSNMLHVSCKQIEIWRVVRCNGYEMMNGTTGNFSFSCRAGKPVGFTPWNRTYSQPWSSIFDNPEKTTVSDSWRLNLEKKESISVLFESSFGVYSVNFNSPSSKVFSSSVKNLMFEWPITWTSGRKSSWCSGKGKSSGKNFDTNLLEKVVKSIFFTMWTIFPWKMGIYMWNFEKKRYLI